MTRKQIQALIDEGCEIHILPFLKQVDVRKPGSVRESYTANDNDLLLLVVENGRIAKFERDFVILKKN